jgi:PAS domain S-box-containing protein
MSKTGSADGAGEIKDGPGAITEFRSQKILSSGTMSSSTAAIIILIVDDQIQNRDLLEALLRPEGYVTLCTANGEEALAQVAQFTPDLILLDIVMPGMDGYQVAGNLKANLATANIPIIMVSADIERSVRLASLNAGVEDFLTKPVDRAELLLRVRNLLRLKAFGDIQRHNAILEQQVQAHTADLQRFRTAMDATGDAILLVSRSTMCFVEVNATACSMLGYTRDELFEVGPAQLGAATLVQLESVYDAIIAGHGINELTETTLRRKDGSLLQVEVRQQSQRFGADWIIVGVARDITERKKDDRKFKDLLESTPDAMVITNSEGEMVLVNAQAVNLFGWRREEMLGQKIELLVPERLKCKHQESQRSFSAQPIIRAMGAGRELFGRQKDGTEFPVEISLSPLQTAEGTLVISAIRDITKRKEAESILQHLAQFRLSEAAKQEAILNALPAPIALLDIRGVIISVNQAWRQFADANALQGPNYVMGLNYLEICDNARGDDSSEAHQVAAGIRSVLEGAAKNYSIEYPCHSSTEQRWFHLTVTPLEDVQINGAVVMHMDITERMRALIELKATKNLLQRTLDSLPVAVFVKDAESRFLLMNKTCEAQWGMRFDDLAGTDGSQYFPVEQMERFLALDKEAFSSGREFNFEEPFWSVTHKKNRVGHTFKNPIFDANGNPLYLVCASLDITERHEAEGKLRESERRFRNLLKNVEMASMMLDLEARITYCNEYLLRVSGWQLEEIIGRNWFEVFKAPEIYDLKDGMVSLLATMPEAWHRENEIVTRSGERRFISWNNSVLRSVDGEVIGIASVGQDITEQRKDQESLRQNEERTRLIIESALDPVVVMDATGCITDWNSQAERTFGWSREQVVGTHLTETLVPTRYRTEHKLGLGRFLETGEGSIVNRRIEISAMHRDGHEIPVELSVTPIRAGGAWIFSSFIRDLTERREAEKRLHDLNVNLEQRVIDRTIDLEQARNEANAANQAKSSFLAAMSHEIRTPMNGVIGMVDVLHHTSLKGYQVEMVDLIRESGFSLLRIIDDILDFSKIEAGRLEIDCAPISLLNVVENACGMLDQLADKKGVELTLFVDPALPELVLGDELRVRQVLLNLVSNAIKFSSGREQAGRVSVRVVPTQFAAGQVGVEIHVADNGIGMDEETQGRLFAAFTQADTSTTRRFGGTGLGLVISRHLVKLMGGYLKLHSTSGQGSTFTVGLQFALLQSKAGSVNPASEVTGLCCLSIGGQDGLAETIAAYLSHGGARVERAADLAQASTQMRELPPGAWVWIIDFVDNPPHLEELRSLVRSLPQHDIHFLVIGRGARRQPRAKEADLVVVDGNVLTRRRLLRTVAIAAGRAVEEEQLLLPGQHEAAFNAPPRDAAVCSGHLILVAEDNQTNQKVILRQLALLGFAADVADNGRVALTRWRSGDYALLLTDLHMPEMDGYELTASIRAEEQGVCRIPILALTANTIKGEADRCRAGGMDDYLSKPLQLADLKAALETWLPAAVPSLHSPAEGIPHATAQAAAAPAVDVSVLESLIGDDAAMILEFLQDFQNSAATIALELKSACDHRQPVPASEQAHKLKSSARAVGALALGELCVQMEIAGRAGSTEALDTLLPRFEQELDAVNAFLDSLLAQRADAATINERQES